MMDDNEAQRLKQVRRDRAEVYRDVARRLHPEHAPRDRTRSFVDVDPLAAVSAGTNPGAWVAAWIWIPDSMVPKEVPDGATDNPNG